MPSGRVAWAILFLTLSNFGVAQEIAVPPPMSDVQSTELEKPHEPAKPETLPDAPSYTRQPNAPCYTPLTGKQKFNIFVRQTYSPFTFASAMFNAGWAQAMDDWPQYGQGLEGYGKRFGASLVNTEARVFFQSFLLPTLLHQDPRYFPSRKKGFLLRSWYAGTRVFVIRNDNGKNVFNSSEFISTLLSSSLQNAYYPEQDRSFGNTMTRALGTYGSDAGANVLREFWPEIKRAIKKHTPEKVERMRKKVPIGRSKAGDEPTQ